MKAVLGTIAIAATLAGAMLFSACESEGPAAGEVLRIEPSEKTLGGSNETTVVFEATGGEAPYTWKVSDSTRGTVSGSGPIVTYTRTAAVGANTVMVEDGNHWTATAQVTQKASP